MEGNINTKESQKFMIFISVYLKIEQNIPEKRLFNFKLSTKFIVFAPNSI